MANTKKSTKKVTKKPTKKVTTKENKREELTTMLVLGILLFSISDYNDGGILEKIIVICGYIFTVVSSIGLMIHHKKEKQKSLVIMFAILAILATAMMIGIVVNGFINK